MKKSIIHGVLAGIASVVFFQVMYMIDSHWFIDYKLKLASVLLFLPFMSRAAAEPAMEDVKKGIRAAFLVFIVGNGIYYLYYYFQFNVFDTDLLTLLKEEMVRYGGVKMEQLEDYSVLPQEVFFLFIRSLIGGFVLSSLVAVVLSRA